MTTVGSTNPSSGRNGPSAVQDSIYEQYARLGNATSTPKRLELLDLLCQGPLTVEPLAEQAGCSVANASLANSSPARGQIVWVASG